MKCRTDIVGAPRTNSVIPLSPLLSLVSQQVRETETWMPMKTTQTAAMLTHRDTLESSGSDFGFTDDGEDDHYTDTPYDDEDEYEYDDFSGSGDGGQSSGTY